MALRALSFTPDAAFMDDEFALERSEPESSGASACSCVEAASALQSTLGPRRKMSADASQRNALQLARRERAWRFGVDLGFFRCCPPRSPPSPTRVAVGRVSAWRLAHRAGARRTLDAPPCRAGRSAQTQNPKCATPNVCGPVPGFTEAFKHSARQRQHHAVHGRQITASGARNA